MPIINRQRRQVTKRLINNYQVKMHCDFFKSFDASCLHSGYGYLVIVIIPGVING